jgi:CelD/BcsL family acetyltransferase involved in cellulose biosynthesis
MRASGYRGLMEQALTSVDSLQEEWAELADRVEAPPFLHPGWIAAWCDEFSGRTASVLAVRREGRLAGLVPFVEEPTGTVSPTNWHTPRFGLLAEDVSARRELCRLLVERARHRLDVCFLYSGSDDVHELQSAAANAGHRVQVRSTQRSPFVDLDGSWEDYEKRVPSKRLREVRRRRRKLEALGEVTVSFVQPSAEELPPLLDEGFQVEGSGWKSEQGTAILSSPSTEGFYREVARWAAERGWLNLAFLRLDGRVAAFDMCLEAHGRVYVLKGGFDTELRSFGPRNILLHDSLRRAFASGMRSYEFLGADDDYKLPWATGARNCLRLQAFPQSATGTVGYLAYRFGRPAAKRAMELRQRIAS